MGRSEISNPALHTELWKCRPLRRENAEGLGWAWVGEGQGSGRGRGSWEARQSREVTTFLVAASEAAAVGATR